MKTLLLTLCIAVATAAQAADIILQNGTVLKNARIISVTGEQVTIVHSGGAASVSTNDVDLETLARAKMALESRDADRKAKAEVAAGKAAERKVETDRRAKEKLDVALAMSAARGNTHQEAPAIEQPKPKANPQKSAPVRQKPVVDTSARIAALKAAFPAKSPGSARVFIPKSGKNDKPYIVSSTVSQLPGGGSYSSTTTRHNAGPGRIDTIQYEAPSAEMWGWYRGMMQTTTLEALPRTLQMVEARMAEDTAKLQQAAGGSSMSVAAQAEHTMHWFQKTLQPYLTKWHALLKQ